MSSTPQLAQSPDATAEAIVVPINRSFTDGSDSTWPKDPKYGFPDDSVYREKLAKLWLQKTGAYQNGMLMTFFYISIYIFSLNMLYLFTIVVWLGYVGVD